jgi:hypothetical protein
MSLENLPRFSIWNALGMMRIRKRTVEHPFGTLKQWMGATHFFGAKAGRRQCRNELERTHLQNEAVYENPRHQQPNEGVIGLKGWGRCLISMLDA